MSALLATVRRRVVGPREELPARIAFAIVAFLLIVVAPSMLSDFRLGLLAKYLVFAIVAVGIALAWGRGGMLVLGQGLFFGLGGYAMAMHLQLAEAPDGQPPAFMTLTGAEHVPGIWGPFESTAFTLAMVVLLPMLAATLLGLLVFRSRVRGPYFAILTQALAAAFVIFLVGQQQFSGGTNGLTVMTFFGLDLADPDDKRTLYLIVVAVLALVFLIGRQLVRSRYGRLLVAVRDAEDRVRFLGYDPTLVKVVAFAASAGMAGLAGALFVPVVGIISPASLGIVPSIEMVIWVAVGGRLSLAGAIAGAVLVNYAKTELSEQLPSAWLYGQGLLFVVVVAFAPRGIAGIGEWLRENRGRLRRGRDATPAAATTVEEGA
ncbi:Urea ABC transporter permease protein UrtC [Patulibacter medicamentivorans]|uniref:Urea ABC transporter permease protein UrtC n=1 Tax=Patulibacter medicamentivorans TaxID=1097667 RepID=H0EB18_9ACTN|nr:urea ABC transporter permease subunit UrtC [Patulibacter medicamentivorans]EHN09093.1 Urea ABC transporter permease protein UrtC [Patulibacter medicamentivorans]